jgi:hypothetical protein
MNNGKEDKPFHLEGTAMSISNACHNILDYVIAFQIRLTITFSVSFYIAKPSYFREKRNVVQQ